MWLHRLEFLLTWLLVLVAALTSVAAADARASSEEQDGGKCR